MSSNKTKLQKNYEPLATDENFAELTIHQRRRAYARVAGGRSTISKEIEKAANADPNDDINDTTLQQAAASQSLFSGVMEMNDDANVKTNDVEKRSYTYYRLGSFPEDEDQSGDQTELRVVPSEWVLVGWYLDPKETYGLQLLKVYTWTINDMLIGDCGNGEEVKQLTKSVRLDEKYQSAVTTRDLQKLLCASKKQPSWTGTDWTPVLPSYSFNKVDMEMYGGVAVKRPLNEKLYVAMRFVSHLDGDPVAFPPVDMEIACKETDDVEGICEQLNVKLKFPGQGNVIEKEVKRLFEAGKVETWEWELWVLPLLEGGDKLFRFRDGTLTQFLDVERVAEDVYVKLFMEAHVVPKQDVEPKEDEEQPHKKRKLHPELSEECKQQ